MKEAGIIKKSEQFDADDTIIIPENQKSIKNKINNSPELFDKIKDGFSIQHEKTRDYATVINFLLCLQLTLNMFVHIRNTQKFERNFKQSLKMVAAIMAFSNFNKYFTLYYLFRKEKEDTLLNNLKQYFWFYDIGPKKFINSSVNKIIDKKLISKQEKEEMILNMIKSKELSVDKIHIINSYIQNSRL